MKITGILISTDKYFAETIEIETKLQDYYRVLNCDCIDIVTRKIGNKYYDIVCDDESLLKYKPTMTAMSMDQQHYLFGNLLITNSDANGELTSLSMSDINHIQDYLMEYEDMRMGTKNTVLVMGV